MCKTLLYLCIIINVLTAIFLIYNGFFMQVIGAIAILSILFFNNASLFEEKLKVYVLCGIVTISTLININIILNIYLNT